MKIITATLLFCVFYSAVFAALPESDHVKTNNGDFIIQPVHHGSLVLTWNKQTVYVDPYGGGKLYQGLSAPDLILITDIHPDHLDTNTLAEIATDKATFIAPQAVADLMPERYKQKLIVIGNNDTTSFGGIEIEAIPMYNITEEKKMMHVKGRGNGYVLTFGDKRVYISGDTEDIPEMRQLNNIDIAFVCMNLPYTMDISQAASAVLEFKPAVVYPYHYRGKEGKSDVEKFRKLVHEKNKNIDVRLRDWYTE